MSENAQPIRLALAVGATWAAVMVLAFVTRAALGEQTPVAVVLAVGMLLALPVLTRLGERLHVPGTLAGLATGYALMAPLLVLGGLHSTSRVVLAAQWRCGTGELNLLLGAPFFLGALGVLAQECGYLLVSWRRAPGILRGLAIAAWLLALPLLGAASGRALHRPDVDHYADQLPLVAVLAPVDKSTATVEARSAVPGGATVPLPTTGADGPGGRRRASREPVEVFVDSVAGQRLERRCQGTGCTVHLVNTDAAETTAGRSATQPRTRRTGSDARVDRHDGLRVRATPGGHVLIVEGSGRRFGFVRGEHQDLLLRDLAAHASPPLGWLLGGLLGALFAGALTRRRWGQARLLAPAAEGADGGGDDASARLQERLRALRQERVVALDALTWAVLALFLAPLLSAALVGLVF